jgi:uncharacterized protein
MVVVIAALAWAASAAAWQVDVPPFLHRVVDDAGMLTPDEADKLDRLLASYQAATGGQIAVLLVTSTAPESIDQFAIRVAEDWKPGRKGVDDGVLILVARDNPPALRRMRIEAGRGVQGELTDAQSNRILQDDMAPSFRTGDWYAGLDKGVEAVARVVHPDLVRTSAGYPAPVTLAAAPAPSEDGFNGGIVIVVCLIGLFLFCIGLVISVIFTKGGRTRISDGKFPEVFLVWILQAFLNGSSSEKNSGSGSGSSGGGTRSAGSRRGSGTFDGGGASGNW